MSLIDDDIKRIKSTKKVKISDLNKVETLIDLMIKIDLIESKLNHVYEMQQDFNQIVEKIFGVLNAG